MEETKKLFAKVKMVSSQYFPALTGKKGFSGKVVFPLEAVYSEDHFSLSEIRKAVADALSEWAIEVFASEKVAEKCLETVMSYPGSYHFLPSGDLIECPDDKDLKDVFYVYWDLKEYSIRYYIENAYFEDAKIISVPVGSGNDAMVTARQAAFDVYFGISVCTKEQFWKDTRAEAEAVYLDMFSPKEAERKAVAALIGSGIDAHLERFTVSECCEMLNVPGDDTCGVYYTEGDHCYALLCVPVANNEKRRGSLAGFLSFFALELGTEFPFSFSFQSVCRKRSGKAICYTNHAGGIHRPLHFLPFLFISICSKRHAGAPLQ